MIHPKITHNGKLVHTTNSEGQRIHATDEGIKKFHDWFGDSKIVDEHGRPQVVYHGTTKDFDAFKTNDDLGNMLFVTPDRGMASAFTGGRSSSIMPLYARVSSIPSKVYHAADEHKIGLKMKLRGHDGIRVQDHPNDTVNYGIFDPKNIKSTLGNNGSYSDSDKITENTDYKGEHTSPCPESGAPIHNVSGVYPDDFYTHSSHYSDGLPHDHESISVFHSVRNKPKALVKIYRAVPKVMSHDEKISEINKQKAYILRHGKVPPNVSTSLKRSDYYEKISNDLDELSKIQNPPLEAKMKIEHGDWVTPSLTYAKDHGRGNLNNNYRILSKTVRASELYTSGDSIHELGYHPKRKLGEEMLFSEYRKLIRESVQLDGIEKEWVDSGRYDLSTKKSDNSIEHTFAPKISPNGVRYETRPGRGVNAWHDPEISTLHIGSFHSSPTLNHGSGYTAEPEEQVRDGVIFRGMSSEEYHSAMKNGYIESNGNSNMGSQSGLTYYSHSPKQAAFYAGNFANPKHKPSGIHPAYVVAVKDPKTGVSVSGTGIDEVGIPHRIPTSDILRTHIGRVYAGEDGSVTKYKDFNKYVSGGSQNPTTYIGWKELKGK